MADYSILEQVKIRLRQFHVDDDDTVVFDKKEENPLLNQLIEQAKKGDCHKAYVSRYIHRG